MSITGNVGEWSEIYALFKLLGDKRLVASNEYFEAMDNFFFPIVKILRTELETKYEYTLNEKLVLITANGVELLSIPILEFAKKAQLTLEEIQKNKANKKPSFSIPEIEAFMTKIKCNSLKASSSVKTDVTIVVHDERTNQQPVLGFSIKSQLGNPSTLLNASKATNICYRVKGLTFDDVLNVNNINNKTKIISRINKIKELGGNLRFHKVNNSIFSNNLRLIDSLLPEIISELLLVYYQSNSSNLAEISEAIELENPLKFDNVFEHKFYSYKLKKLLTEIALGLMPSKVWTGKYDATGGYLVIKSSGDIVCYHLYNKNSFEEYLYSNTKFETASTTRHSFGELYIQDKEIYINLNLQIRFLK
jgi:hypothetical protein